MLYKIRNATKKKKIDTSVIGRVVDFNLYEIRKYLGSNEHVFIKCISDCNGVPYPKGQNAKMRLNGVVSVNWFFDKKVVVIEDRNTVYTFDRIRQ